MIVFMELLIFFIALTILGIAAQFFGADSRGDADARPRTDHWNLPHA